MCDPEFIAAILENLGYLDEKKKKEKKEAVHEEENMKEDTRNSKEGKQK